MASVTMVVIPVKSEKIVFYLLGGGNLDGVSGLMLPGLEKRLVLVRSRSQ